MLSVSFTLIHSRCPQKPAPPPGQISTGTVGQFYPGANNLDGYFDKLATLNHQGCDEEIYAMNQTWLIKAREIARENPVLTELVLGITDDAMRIALGHLSLEDIQFIARSNWLCFSPRFSSQFLMNINKEQPPIVEAMLGLTGSICWESGLC